MTEHLPDNVYEQACKRVWARRGQRSDPSPTTSACVQTSLGIRFPAHANLPALAVTSNHIHVRVPAVWRRWSVNRVFPPHGYRVVGMRWVGDSDEAEHIPNMRMYLHPSSLHLPLFPAIISAGRVPDIGHHTMGYLKRGLQKGSGWVRRARKRWRWWWWWKEISRIDSSSL